MRAKGRIARVQEEIREGKATPRDLENETYSALSDAEDTILTQAEQLARAWKRPPDRVLEIVTSTSMRPNTEWEAAAGGVMGWRGNLFMNPKYSRHAGELYAHEVPGHMGERIVTEYLRNKLPPERLGKMTEALDESRHAYEEMVKLEGYNRLPQLLSTDRDRIENTLDVLHGLIPMELPAQAMESLPYGTSEFVDILREGMRYVP